jgi:hypothetical protein
MEHEKAITAIMLIALVIMTVVLFLHWGERRAMRQDISQMDAEFVTKELHRRAAEDCVVTPVPGGYRCVEMRTGKVFMVKR